MHQRKCSNCGHWNDAVDYCVECNHLISLTKQIEIEQEAKAEAKANETPDKFDIFLHAFENSRFLPIRLVYKLLYSIWLGFIAILSFFLYALAWGPG